MKLSAVCGEEDVVMYIECVQLRQAVLLAQQHLVAAEYAHLPCSQVYLHIGPKHWSSLLL